MNGLQEQFYHSCSWLGVLISQTKNILNGGMKGKYLTSIEDLVCVDNEMHVNQ